MAKAKDNTLIVWVLPLLILSNVIVYISADVYAAVTELEELVYLEQRLINASRNFIKEERKKLAGLKQFAQAVEIASELSSGNPEEYIANPINSYLLLKRFTWGWKELGSLLNLSEEKLKGIVFPFYSRVYFDLASIIVGLSNDLKHFPMRSKGKDCL